MTSLEESKLVQQWGKKMEDAIVGRQDGYNVDRLTQTGDTCVKGVEFGSRLRAPCWRHLSSVVRRKNN